MRLRIFGLACLLALSGACIPPEPDDDVIIDWDPEETVMGEIQEKGELVAAIPVDRMPFGDIDDGAGKGLTADLARLIGDALGVETRFVKVEQAELITGPEDQTVDISFPLVAITERRVRKNIFSDPFYIAHQRLLVQPDSPIQQVEDISGAACQFVAQEVITEAGRVFVQDIGVDLKEIDPELTVTSPPDPATCLEELDRGRIEAISASDWLLYPAVAENPDRKIVGDQLSTEGYGAVIESGASAWQDFVNSVFAEADQEGDWQRFYDSWFGPYVDEPVTYPEMTVEEVAALFPKPEVSPAPDS
ncbi:MAG TPA: transporter substrate-binding domain-containing protein [Actinomycetota bacterium]|nr:transporter substrate-binding domain-containing protein [Actinomycetota bacterium]